MKFGSDRPGSGFGKKSSESADGQRQTMTVRDFLLPGDIVVHDNASCRVCPHGCAVETLGMKYNHADRLDRKHFREQESRQEARDRG